IEEVAKFLGVSPTQKIKTLALMQLEDDAKNPGQKRTRPVIVLLRGDHSLNEAKLTTVLNGKEFRAMHAEEIEQVFRSPAGYLGPVKLPALSNAQMGNETQKLQLPPQPAKTARVGDPVLESLPLLLADIALQGRKNLITGANKEDYHLKNVTPGRDF